jgi:hypothetical protein
MDPKNEEPFNREPWRRLLDADSGAPTQDMDRRILAEARRALTPRVVRWWLPASLAASVLLAVLIVQWQLADSGAPAHVTEYDVMSVPAPIEADEAAPAAAMELPAQRQEESAKAAANVPPPLTDLPPLEPRRAPASEATAAAPASPAAARSRADATATLAPMPAPVQEQAQAEPAAALGKLHAKESYEESRTPEEWYADIEALRTSGRIKEADAELARFKSKYPGWLERHQQQNP